MLNSLSGSAGYSTPAHSPAPAAKARRIPSPSSRNELPPAECRLIGMLLNGLWHDTATLDGSLFVADWLRRAYVGIIALRQQGKPPVDYILDDALPAGELAGLQELAAREHSTNTAMLAHCARRIQRDALERQLQAAAAAADLAACKRLIEQIEQIEQAAAPGDLRVRLGIRSATEILNTVYPDPRWAVPNILPEGLTLLAGPPKGKKSWFALGVGIAIATGGVALGQIKVEQGRVLYLALEDRERRLQKRMRRILRETGADLSRLDLVTDWPRLDKGGLDWLRQYLQQHPDTRLVIIDTLAKIKVRRRRTDLYEDDYQALSELKRVADDASASMLVITHTRKAESEDFLDAVLGTHGVTGAADGGLVLTRDRCADNAVLSITGRDIEEERKLSLLWDVPTCTWHIQGVAEEYAGSNEWLTLRALLKGGPMTTMEITAALHDPRPVRFDGTEYETVRKALRRYRDGGRLESYDDAVNGKQRQFWRLPAAPDKPDATPVPAVPPVPVGGQVVVSTSAPTGTVTGTITGTPVPVVPVGEQTGSSTENSAGTGIPRVPVAATGTGGTTGTTGTAATGATVATAVCDDAPQDPAATEMRAPRVNSSPLDGYLDALLAEAEPAADLPSRSSEPSDTPPPRPVATVYWLILKDGSRIGKRFAEPVPLTVATATGRKLYGDAFSHAHAQEGSNGEPTRPTADPPGRVPAVRRLNR